MANKKTVAITKEQYKTIITELQSGAEYTGRRPNERVAMALQLEANLGLRISDIIKLRLSDIVKDGKRYRLNIREQKTGKERTFTVPKEVYAHIHMYCIEHDIAPDEVIIPITERAIQKQLKIVCEYLGEGYENISTHSFRKYFATEIYINSNYNIELVRQLLQHSSTAVTQRYIGIGSAELEGALNDHMCFI